MERNVLPRFSFSFSLITIQVLINSHGIASKAVMTVTFLWSGLRWIVIFYFIFKKNEIWGFIFKLQLLVLGFIFKVQLFLLLFFCDKPFPLKICLFNLKIRITYKLILSKNKF